MKRIVTTLVAVVSLSAFAADPAPTTPAPTTNTAPAAAHMETTKTTTETKTEKKTTKKKNEKSAETKPAEGAPKAE